MLIYFFFSVIVSALNFKLQISTMKKINHIYHLYSHIKTTEEKIVIEHDIYSQNTRRKFLNTVNIDGTLQFSYKLSIDLDFFISHNTF